MPHSRPMNFKLRHYRQLHDGFRGDFHCGGLRMNKLAEFHALCV